MTTQLLMNGQDRTYQPPRSLRRAASELPPVDRLASRVASGRCDAWDLLALEERQETSTWAKGTLSSVLASIDAEAADVLGCTDCADTGFYGLADSGNPDLLVGLLRRVGDGEYESLQADGIWQPGASADDAEILTLEIAEDLVAALTAGASGLLRKYCWPVAFLPPSEVVAAAPLTELISTADAVTPHGEWVNFAVVDDDDVGAVMQLIRLREEGTAESYQAGAWEQWDPEDGDLLAIPLDDETFAEIMGGLTASIQSPDPRAARLRRYWSVGRGGAKIRWGTPGDWKRCYRHLRKYLGLRAKGYCQLMHKSNTGVYTGSRFNVGGNGRRRGHHLLSSASIEEDLAAAVESGLWTGESEGNSDMAEAAIKDGIYCEVDDNVELLRTLTAGGFPVAPPDEWYENPGFTAASPMQVDDDGHVYGHIAPWGVTHIGMAGKIPAPRSASGYQFFLTGSVKTASGKLVNVGQLTLTGGHAPMHASAEEAVKHYDDTNSAVADVTVGEDEYGIWAAGALRPDVTPEQIRAFRASPLSGDWRPINGNLELVAACAVNVPGFPIARARVASGAVLALVAAGARALAEQRASLVADAALLERIDKLEHQVFPPVTQEVETAAPDPNPAAVEVLIDNEPVAATAAVVEAAADPVEAVEAAEVQAPEQVQEEVADKLDPEQVSRVREDAKAIKRDWIRKSVHGVTASMLPPQFKENAAKKAATSDKKIPETERKGGGYPIKDAASLRDAIQAFGRSKPEDRARTKAHIIAAAHKLGLTKLLPEKW